MQGELARAPNLLVIRHDPVGEPLEARAQALILQVLDEATISQRQFGNDRAGERRILIENRAHSRGRNEHDHGACRGARRFEIELIEHNRSQDKGARRRQEGQGRLSTSAGREKLDRTLERTCRKSAFCPS